MDYNNATRERFFLENSIRNAEGGEIQASYFPRQVNDAPSRMAIYRLPSGTTVPYRIGHAENAPMNAVFPRDRMSHQLDPSEMPTLAISIVTPAQHQAAYPENVSARSALLALQINGSPIPNIGISVAGISAQNLYAEDGYANSFELLSAENTYRTSPAAQASFTVALPREYDATSIPAELAHLPGIGLFPVNVASPTTHAEQVVLPREYDATSIPAELAHLPGIGLFPVNVTSPTTHGEQVVLSREYDATSLPAELAHLPGIALFPVNAASPRTHAEQVALPREYDATSIPASLAHLPGIGLFPVNVASPTTHAEQVSIPVAFQRSRSHTWQPPVQTDHMAVLEVPTAHVSVPNDRVAAMSSYARLAENQRRYWRALGSPGVNPLREHSINSPTSPTADLRLRCEYDEAEFEATEGLASTSPLYQPTARRHLKFGNSGRNCDQPEMPSSFVVPSQQRASDHHLDENDEEDGAQTPTFGSPLEQPANAQQATYWTGKAGTSEMSPFDNFVVQTSPVRNNFAGLSQMHLSDVLDAQPSANQPAIYGVPANGVGSLSAELYTRGNPPPMLQAPSKGTTSANNQGSSFHMPSVGTFGSRSAARLPTLETGFGGRPIESSNLDNSLVHALQNHQYSVPHAIGSNHQEAEKPKMPLPFDPAIQTVIRHTRQGNNDIRTIYIPTGRTPATHAFCHGGAAEHVQQAELQTFNETALRSLNQGGRLGDGRDDGLQIAPGHVADAHTRNGHGRFEKIGDNRYQLPPGNTPVAQATGQNHRGGNRFQVPQISTVAAQTSNTHGRSGESGGDAQERQLSHDKTQTMNYRSRYGAVGDGRFPMRTTDFPNARTTPNATHEVSGLVNEQPLDLPLLPTPVLPARTQGARYGAVGDGRFQSNIRKEQSGSHGNSASKGQRSQPRTAKKLAGESSNSFAHPNTRRTRAPAIPHGQYGAQASLLSQYDRHLNAEFSTPEIGEMASSSGNQENIHTKPLPASNLNSNAAAFHLSEMDPYAEH